MTEIAAATDCTQASGRSELRRGYILARCIHREAIDRDDILTVYDTRFDSRDTSRLDVLPSLFFSSSDFFIAQALTLRRDMRDSRIDIPVVKLMFRIFIGRMIDEDHRSSQSLCVTYDISQDQRDAARRIDGGSSARSIPI